VDSAHICSPRQHFAAILACSETGPKRRKVEVRGKYRLKQFFFPSLPQFVEVTLSDQSLNVSLPNIELAVLGQGNGSANPSSAMFLATPVIGRSGPFTYPYSV
jgi:hypothetical protein